MNSVGIRLYNFIATRKYKQLIRRHYSALFDEKSRAKGVNFWRILMATSIMDIDREFTWYDFFSNICHVTGRIICNLQF